MIRGCSMLAVVLIVMSAQAAPSGAAELTVLTIRVGEIVLDEVGREFARATGHTLRVRVGLAPALGRAIEAGEPFDVAILAAPVLDGLITKGKIVGATRVDVLRGAIGVCVRAGAPRPDISTVDAFKRALLGAKSIAYLREGASGVYIAGLLPRLGIADELKSKTIAVEGDRVGETVASGGAELGMGVVPNLMTVPGVDVVGPLPAEIQSYITWAAGVGAASGQTDAARALIEFLRSPAVASVIKAKGLERPSL